MRGVIEHQWVGIFNTQEEKDSPVLWSPRTTEVTLGVGRFPGNYSGGRGVGMGVEGRRLEAGVSRRTQLYRVVARTCSLDDPLLEVLSMPCPAPVNPSDYKWT